MLSCAGVRGGRRSPGWSVGFARPVEVGQCGRPPPERLVYQSLDHSDGLDRVASTAHEQFNVDPDVEFHAHDIMQGRKSWECFSGQVHEAVALYPAAARAVRESGALLIIEGFMNLNHRVRGVQIELLGQFFANSVRSKIGNGCPK